MVEYANLSEQQKEQVKAVAKSRGLTVSDYMKQICNEALYKCSGSNKSP